MNPNTLTFPLQEELFSLRVLPRELVRMDAAQMATPSLRKKRAEDEEKAIKEVDAGKARLIPKNKHEMLKHGGMANTHNWSRKG